MRMANRVAGMITLYTFGRRFGLPDASPFVSKAELLLKMSGLPFQLARRAPNKAPKGKLPYIDDNGTIVADSTFIRRHLESRHGVDFDKGFGERDKAIGWAFEKMCEDHLYWAVVESRWLDDANWQKTRGFFDAVPSVVRPLVGSLVRRGVKKALHAHGIGRHSRADIEALAARDLDAIATYLDDKPFFLGNAPSGTDATIWAFVSSALCEAFATPIRIHAESKPNLVAYRDRLMAGYFPELAKR